MTTMVSDLATDQCRGPATNVQQCPTNSPVLQRWRLSLRSARPRPGVIPPVATFPGHCSGWPRVQSGAAQRSRRGALRIFRSRLADRPNSSVDGGQPPSPKCSSRTDSRSGSSARITRSRALRRPRFTRRARIHTLIASHVIGERIECRRRPHIRVDDAWSRRITNELNS